MNCLTVSQTGKNRMILNPTAFEAVPISFFKDTLVVSLGPGGKGAKNHLGDWLSEERSPSKLVFPLASASTDQDRLIQEHPGDPDPPHPTSSGKLKSLLVLPPKDFRENHIPDFQGTSRKLTKFLKGVKYRPPKLWVRMVS